MPYKHSAHIGARKLRQLKSGFAKQQGIASLVFVLLVTLVIASSTTSAVKSIRNTQEVNTAVNSVSHAQTATWVAAEAYRLYLETLTRTSMQALAAGNMQQINIGQGTGQAFGTITAQIVNATETITDTFQIEARITNRHAAARSSATLAAVYDVVITTVTPTPVPPTPTVNFNHGLNVNGGIELTSSGKPVNLTVQGDVNLGGVSVNPINELHATGKVTIGSSVTINSIYADDDVVLNNTRAQTVRTLGDLTANGSATVTSIQANGNVLINASGRFEQVSSRQTITVTSGGAGQGVLTAAGNIDARTSGPIDSLNAKGNITLGNYFPIGHAVSEGNIKCVSQWWRDVDVLSANGSLIDCPGASATITAVSGASNVVVPPPELTPRTLTAPDIDVWKLRDDANYFVSYNTATSRIEVTVKNINGLVDDTVYKLGTFRKSGAPYIDYLCNTVANNGTCTSPSQPTAPICLGQSPYNSCITYDDSSNTFRVNPNQTAPGVIFFDGNLELGNGHGISTILASGNIRTSGQFVQWAANRGSYSSICEANADNIKNSLRARYTEAFSKHYPTNLCDIANNDYLPIPTGNIGLAAGGNNPDIFANPYSTYTGGNISLGASTRVVGAVLAGNFLSTNGEVRIQGPLSAGALGDTSTGQNSLGAKTIVDFSGIGDFDPLDLPVPTPVSPPQPTIQVNSTISGLRPL